jgi:hypothetical protein
LTKSRLKPNSLLGQGSRTESATYIEIAKALLETEGQESTLLKLLGREDLTTNDKEQVKVLSRLRSLLITKRNIGHIWDFSEREYEDLSNYIEASSLLLDCLRVSFVSDRHKIEAHLLNPLF